MDDISAIATWERGEAPDPNATGPSPAYRCTTCDWTGRGEKALRHYRETGHAIRGRDWPASWPNCLWSTPPVYATFAFDWPEVGAQYTVHGGERDGSTVSLATLQELGIEVRK